MFSEPHIYATTAWPPSSHILKQSEPQKLLEPWTSSSCQSTKSVIKFKIYKLGSVVWIFSFVRQESGVNRQFRVQRP